VIESLEERVRRYPPERYPVQHATAQFHLGVALANAGRADAAEEALRAAVLLFDQDALPVEHAKALNALGAALRARGRLDEAAEAFRAAVEAFASVGEEREHGAAVFNLGLVERERDRPDDATAHFAESAKLLGEARAPALRELGALLLEHGDVAAAIRTLEDAAALHAQLDDEPGRGAAANTLGLAYLASGRAAEAIAVFREALASYPRTIRGNEYAMVKANIALAYEQVGDLSRARLAARQALTATETPAAVAEQARGVLDRIGSVTDDLAVVLKEEPEERWPAILREEVLHWERADAAAFVDADPSSGLTEAWLGALLELPPEEMQRAIETTLGVLGERTPEERARFETAVRAVLPRFHQPQMLRLEGAFGWSSPAT
jgi:tetratricopeptide (TPR) repeat protein